MQVQLCPQIQGAEAGKMCLRSQALLTAEMRVLKVFFVLIL